MKKVYFTKAGNLPNLERVYFMPRNRVQSLDFTTYHNNRYTSVWSIPAEFYRNHFVFDRSTNVYRTTLKYSDIAQFLEVIDRGN